jgi:secreted Zn-dependent insulinase-like peptidase
LDSSVHLFQIHAGSLHEEEDQQGLAHYLEHCVFLGTEKYKNSEVIRNLLARWGYLLFFVDKV